MVLALAVALSGCVADDPGAATPAGSGGDTTWATGGARPPLGVTGKPLVNLPDGPASVLLMFDTEVGTVLPAVPGFVAGLTFNEGELLDVAYEPSINSFRWD